MEIGMTIKRYRNNLKGKDMKRASKKTPKSKKGSNITRVIIQYDVGFPNKVTIRGEGAGLTWTQGVDLKNISANEWVWETQANFEECEFKVLLNDQVYEAGENHHVVCGQQLRYSPQF